MAKLKALEKPSKWVTNSLERYAEILYPGNGDAKHRREVARAIIAAFVEDAAKEMCDYCERREAVSRGIGGAGFFHVPSNRRELGNCLASELREAAAKLLGGDDAS